MTTQQKIEFLTPVGRIVAGDPFKANTTDAENRPLVVKNGPNAGQPRVEYYIGVAIPKTDVGYNELYGIIYGAARAAFPNMFDAAGTCINPKFSFKLTDGDSAVPNTKGVAPCTKEGHRGHWIVNLSNGFAPKCYTQGGEALITDPAMLKKGYYVRVYGTVKSNESLQQPGVFLNFHMIELVGYGEEIHSGPDGTSVFGGKSAGALPAGASATPVASAAPLAQPPGGAPAAAPATYAPPAAAAPAAYTPPAAAPATYAPPAAAAPAAYTPPAAAPATYAPPAATAPARTPASAQDFLNPPNSALTPNAAPAPAPAPAGPSAEVHYLHQGNRYTKAQLVAGGWGEAQIAALPTADDEIPF